MTMMVDQLEVEVVQEKSRTTAPSAASDCARRRDRTSIDAGLLLELAALAPACCCCPLARRVSALEFRALRTLPEKPSCFTPSARQAQSQATSVVSSHKSPRTISRFRW